MKAVRKLKTRFAWAVIATTGLCMLFCANPVDEPLKWRTKVEIPVTNNKFYLGQEMPGLLKNLKTENINILFAGRSPEQSGNRYDTNAPGYLLPDTIKGDTVVFSILRKDSISYTTSQDTMKTKTFHPRIGAVTIANSDTIRFPVPLPAGAGSNTVIAYVKVPKLYRIGFDSTSPNISVSVTNTSTTNVPVTAISITMLGSTQTLAGPLNQGETQILQFPTRNHGFTDSMEVSVTATSGAAAGKSLRMDFNCNGLLANFVRCDDHLVTFLKEFTNDYALTDTLDVDYVDMENGNFDYELTNYTSVPIEIHATQLHLWEEPFMTLNNIWKFEDLSRLTAADSARGFYYGNLTTSTPVIRPGFTGTLLHSNLAGLRLFPVWNDTMSNADGIPGKSVSRVVYTAGNAPPVGDTITISAGDSLLFVIRAPNFKFKEMYGEVKKAYVRGGDTARIQVPFPFNKGSKDSLEGNLFLKKVIADIYMTADLPDTEKTTRKAVLDTLNVSYTLLTPTLPDSQVTSSAKFTDVYNKKIARHQLDMTKILNQWPDSMYIAVKINIPVGTHLRAVTDLTTGDSVYPFLMGRMKIKAINTVRMNAVLDWEVRDTAHLDLGVGKFALGKGYKAANKLQDKSFKFLMNVKNKTNAFMNIYALAAPDSLMMAKLDTMSVNNTWSLIKDPAQARNLGFVSLLGGRGVRIPARDSIDESGVDLTDADLQKILTSDTCSFRWQARFIPYAPVHSDALIDTDYIDIRSHATIEGTNNMDSLLIWE